MKKLDLQERCSVTRQRVRTGFYELKKWLDVESFVDCVINPSMQNIKEYDILWEELAAYRQQTEWTSTLKRSE